jgi:hypothetical protein
MSDEASLPTRRPRLRALTFMKRLRPGALACWLVVGAGCGPPEIRDRGGGGAGRGEGAAGAGEAAADPGSVPSFQFPSAPPPAPGGAGGGAAPGRNVNREGQCGFERFTLDKLPPELLLVLDRSGSMLRLAGAGGSRWQQTTAALDQVISRTRDGVVWGLKLFPSDQSCAVADGVNVPPAAGSWSAVTATVQTNGPIDEWPATPTRLAMQKAAQFMSARTSPNPKYLLLATDGLPNCLNGKRDDDDVAGALQAIADAAGRGLKTFVVGIATAGSAAHETLNQMADRGQLARNDRTRYYPVASRDEFVAVLDTIAGQIASCTFALGEQPPSPDDVAVDANKMRVPRDTANQNGWNYGPQQKSIVLYGPWCEKLKSGAITDVQITFGCPRVVIP